MRRCRLRASIGAALGEGDGREDAGGEAMNAKSQRVRPQPPSASFKKEFRLAFDASLQTKEPRKNNFTFFVEPRCSSTRVGSYVG